MIAEKKEGQSTKAPSPATAAPHARKSWTPRSAVEVVLDQIRKQEKRVAELQQELDAEKAMLNKLSQAKKVLEGN